MKPAGTGCIRQAREIGWGDEGLLRRLKHSRRTRGAKGEDKVVEAKVLYFVRILTRSRVLGRERREVHFHPYFALYAKPPPRGGITLRKRCVYTRTCTLNV